MSEHNRGILIQKGCLLLNQGRHVEAIKVFKDGLSLDPEDAYLLYYLALAQHHSEDQERQALKTINEALKYDNEEPAFYQLKSVILAGLKKPQEALEAVEQALELDPEFAPAHAAKSYIYYVQEKWPKAEECARRALSIDANNQFAGSVLANALRMQDKLDESVHLVSDLLANDPEDNLSHTNAGWVYLQRKNYAQAQVHFKEALRLDPNFEPARSGMLEAFKARSLFYRLYLQYCLFMSRQTRAFRLGIIFGVSFLYGFISRGLEKLFHGPGAILGGFLGFLFFVFFFWTWLSGGIGNLLVLCDPTARYALRRSEKLDAIFVGGGFFIGLVLLLLGLMTHRVSLAAFSMGVIGSTIPFAVTFKNKNRHARLFYGGIGVYILFAALVALFGVHFYGTAIPKVLEHILHLAFWAFVLTTWLVAFGFLCK